MRHLRPTLNSGSLVSHFSFQELALRKEQQEFFVTLSLCENCRLVVNPIENRLLSRARFGCQKPGKIPNVRVFTRPYQPIVFGLCFSKKQTASGNGWDIQPQRHDIKRVYPVWVVGWPPSQGDKSTLVNSSPPPRKKAGSGSNHPQKVPSKTNTFQHVQCAHCSTHAQCKLHGLKLKRTLESVDCQLAKEAGSEARQTLMRG